MYWAPNPNIPIGVLHALHALSGVVHHSGGVGAMDDRVYRCWIFPLVCTGQHDDPVERGAGTGLCISPLSPPTLLVLEVFRFLFSFLVD